jgi:hypothetical protein
MADDDGKTECYFLCGSVKGSTPDPIDAKKTIAWEYETQKNGCDIYCARVYQSDHKHKDPSANAFATHAYKHGSACTHK